MLRSAAKGVIKTNFLQPKNTAAMLHYCHIKRGEKYNFRCHIKKLIKQDPIRAYNCNMNSFQIPEISPFPTSGNTAQKNYDMKLPDTLLQNWLHDLSRERNS